eukprot:645540-Pleurochrysis_carterae.AAC.2
MGCGVSESTNTSSECMAYLRNESLLCFEVPHSPLSAGEMQCGQIGTAVMILQLCIAWELRLGMKVVEMYGQSPA